MIGDIIQKAHDLGFIGTGFSRPYIPLYFDAFLSWLAEGRNGDMAWMEKHIELRQDPTQLLPGCRTIISLAFPYPSAKPATPDGYTISRYAMPEKPDYHDRVRRRCRELSRFIETLFPHCRNRVCVDSAPIMERSFALSAGLGFIGKNTTLIIPGHGSYLYLAEVLTTAALDFPTPDPMPSQCGSCTRCLDACPTGALEEPFRMDARKCLSYLTIEHKGPVPDDLKAKMGRCFFGCDRCQEACPFNKDAGMTVTSLPDMSSLLTMENDDFKKRFGHTALSRAGLKKLKDNAEGVWHKTTGADCDKS